MCRNGSGAGVAMWGDRSLSIGLAMCTDDRGLARGLAKIEVLL